MGATTEPSSKAVEHAQYSTFTVAGRLYGTYVTQVQEIVRPLPMTPVPLAPSYIKGLINLRGQVATAIDLRELFGLPSRGNAECMNVVCKSHGTLLALQVDEIGDVTSTNAADFAPSPPTIKENVRRFLSGIYKMDNELLSIVDVGALAVFLGLGDPAARER